MRFIDISHFWGGQKPQQRKQCRNSCLFSFLKVGWFLPSSENLDSGRTQKRNIVTVKHRSACDVAVRVLTGAEDNRLVMLCVFSGLEGLEAHLEAFSPCPPKLVLAARQCCCRQIAHTFLALQKGGRCQVSPQGGFSIEGFRHPGCVPSPRLDAVLFSGCR